MSKFIPEIISECVDNIRPTSSIISIVDNANNTYTIAVANIDSLLLDNQIVEINNTTGFDTSNIEVFNVDYDNNTFDINLTSGIPTNLTKGSFKAKAPFYYYSNEIEYNNNIGLQSQKIREQIEKFPAVFLPTEFEEIDINYKTFDVSNLKLGVINFTEVNTNTPQRHTNEMPYIFDIYTKLKQQITKHKNIKHIPEFRHTKRYFAELKQGEAINLIETNINLEYNITNCL